MSIPAIPPAITPNQYKSQILQYYPLDNTEQADRLQAAINQAYAQGYGGIFVHPANGPILLDSAKCVIIPKNFTMRGVKGKTVFKASITTIQNKPSFPNVGGAMFALGNPSTKVRYGTQTGRVASGTGATFNLTLTGSAITAATVVSGGTGFKVGDWIYVGNNTTLLVSTVAAVRGAVTGVTVYAGGNWSSSPSNPVAQTGSLGMALWDRILDPNSFADYIHIYDIAIDANSAMPALTGNQQYYGFDIRGCLYVSIVGCEGYNFPNTAFLLTDVKRGYVVGNRADNCGWNGVFGGSRNGFSNIGIYVTTNAAKLNTDAWTFSSNICTKIADVGSQFAMMTGVIMGNQYLGCGTIAIEGEAHAFGVTDYAAVNGGISIPGDVLLSHNKINGTMLDGTLATNTTASANYVSTIALDGISWNANNEGKMHFIANKISNTQRYGIVANQPNNGFAFLESNELDACNSSTDGSVRLQAVLIGAETVKFIKNTVRNCAGGPQVLLYNMGLDVEISGNDFVTCGTGANPVILIQQYRSRTAPRIVINDNYFNSFYNEAVLIESVGSGNTLTCTMVEIERNRCINGNRGHTASVDYPYFHIRTRSSGVLNPVMVNISDNRVLETNLLTPSTAPIVVIEGANSAAPTLVNIRKNAFPQMNTKYSYTMNNAPSVSDYTLNQ